MAASLVAFQALTDAGVTADYCAGHSLGEYTAAIASGVFSVTDGARIVQTRGDAMAHACAQNPGTMAAIVKLDAAHVHALVAEIDGVVVANDNANGQIVVAGDPDAVAKARDVAREQGGRGLPLTVEGAFHSPAMAPAHEPLAAIVAATSTREPSIPLVSGAYARVCTDAADVCQSLVDGLLMPVRWRELQAELQRLNVDTVIEVGPGGVLAGMAKRALDGAHVSTVQNPSDVAAIVAHLKDL
jgi:[acyl-carrier-protein] S-malonyltransferase